MKNTFYAVQFDERYDWDYGSEDFNTAVQMAVTLIEYGEPNVQIARIDTYFCVCDGVIYADAILDYAKGDGLSPEDYAKMGLE